MRPATGVLATNAGDGEWRVGRVGMLYRDLIPGRLDGRFIGSHIRIPTGGPVPDYVHHHDVRFQLIYCLRGWVEVVYEDQGPPFVLAAGDCVLQPPHIRHRVLTASPGLEVVEIASPAEHHTAADAEMQLPTPVERPQRDFDGQRFVRYVAAHTAWAPWTALGWECRDTGIGAATHGLAGVHVIRPAAAISTGPRCHDSDLLHFVVLAGAADVDAAGQAWHLGPAGSAVVPAGLDFTLTATPGSELLEVAVPAAPGPRPTSTAI